MRRAFAQALDELDDERFSALYGPWDPLQPEQVGELLAGSGVRWWIAGGRAARAGSAARPHGDTDVAVNVSSLGALRAHPGNWVFKKNDQVQVPWDEALHVIGAISYLRPELALLHKAHLDRPKDREDLAAARLQPQVRAWLADTLDQVGRHGWAELARSGPAPDPSQPPA